MAAAHASPLTIVSGNLLDAGEQYIVHQTNCLTTRAAHLAYDVFQRFPHADIYAERGRLGVLKEGAAGLRHVPGTIQVRGNIINLLGQLGPGLPRAQRAVAGLGVLPDTAAVREDWFRAGLAAIGALPGVESLAFPHSIGCGAAGGNWVAYRAMLDAFASAHPHIRVVIYQLAK